MSKIVITNMKLPQRGREGQGPGDCGGGSLLGKAKENQLRNKENQSWDQGGTEGGGCGPAKG